jgi:hypothetical protein
MEIGCASIAMINSSTTKKTKQKRMKERKKEKGGDYTWQIAKRFILTCTSMTAAST